MEQSPHANLESHTFVLSHEREVFLYYCCSHCCLGPLPGYLQDVPLTLEIQIFHLARGLISVTSPNVQRADLFYYFFDYCLFYSIY